MGAADIPEIHDFRMYFRHPRRKVIPIGNLLGKLLFARHPFFRFLQIKVESISQRNGAAASQLVRKVVDQSFDALLFASGLGGLFDLLLVGQCGAFGSTAFADTIEPFTALHELIMILFGLAVFTFAFENRHRTTS